MMRNQILRRTAAAVLTLALALTVCGCGGRRGESRRDREKPPKEEVSDEVQPEQTRPAEISTQTDGTFATDSVVLAHTEHNRSLQLREDAPRKASEFHLYVENIEAMEGFVKKMSQYQNCMQAVLGTGYNQYSTLYAHYLAKNPGGQGLAWVQKEIPNGTLRDIYTPEFYRDNHLPENGAISELFRKDATPFQENGLTVVVSSFLEQSFNMNVLAGGIEAYFDAYPGSAAAVLGMRSQLEGRLHIPSQSAAETTFYLDRFSGEIPFYVVVVGPEQAVREYMEDCTAFLDTKDIPFAKCIYTNTVYNQLKSAPLTFELIPDHHEKKAVPPIISSYNAGTLTDNDHGNAFFSTFSSITTRASSSRGREEESTNQVDVGRTTQLALFSRDYDGVSEFRWKTRLYRYDEASSQWVDAGQSANDMVTFRCEPRDGKIVDELSQETVLADGRRELYMTAVLNFAEDSAISRDHIYRLEVSTDLNRKNPNSAPESLSSNLGSFNVDVSKYYDTISRLCVMGHGNYNWVGDSEIARNPQLRTEAAELLAHTPNLDVLVGSLEKIEDKYHPNEQRIQYLDFLVNLPDKNSRR